MHDAAYFFWFWIGNYVSRRFVLPISVIRERTRVGVAVMTKEDSDEVKFNSWSCPWHAKKAKRVWGEVTGVHFGNQQDLLTQLVTHLAQCVALSSRIRPMTALWEVQQVAPLGGTHEEDSIGCFRACDAGTKRIENILLLFIPWSCRRHCTGYRKAPSVSKAGRNNWRFSECFPEVLNRPQSCLDWAAKLQYKVQLIGELVTLEPNMRPSAPQEAQ